MMNPATDQSSAPQLWKEGLRLLAASLRWPRKPDHPYEQADMATISLRDLRTIEQELHVIWFDRARQGYLKAELRRRARVALWRAACLRMQSLRQWCYLCRP